MEISLQRYGECCERAKRRVSTSGLNPADLTLTNTREFGEATLCQIAGAPKFQQLPGKLIVRAEALDSPARP